MAMWPRAPDAGYTGCLYIWLDRQPHYIARFDQGRFVEGITPDVLTDRMTRCGARATDEESLSCAQMRRALPELIGNMENLPPATMPAGRTNI